MKHYIIPETTVLSLLAQTTILDASTVLVAPALSSPADVAPGNGDDGV